MSRALCHCPQPWPSGRGIHLKAPSPHACFPVTLLYRAAKLSPGSTPVSFPPLPKPRPSSWQAQSSCSPKACLILLSFLPLSLLSSFHRAFFYFILLQDSSHKKAVFYCSHLATEVVLSTHFWDHLTIVSVNPSRVDTFHLSVTEGTSQLHVSNISVLGTLLQVLLHLGITESLETEFFLITYQQKFLSATV